MSEPVESGSDMEEATSIFDAPVVEENLDARTIPALNLQQVDDSSKAVQPGENQERADEISRDGGISKWKNAIRPSYRSDQDPGKLGRMDQPEYVTSWGPVLMHFLSKATSESSLVTCMTVAIP